METTELSTYCLTSILHHSCESHSGLNKIQFLYTFPNGFGASVICGKHTYGGGDYLFELAVLNSFGQLVYDTAITDDVLGHLTGLQVNETLKAISEL